MEMVKGRTTTIRCQEISPGCTQIRLEGELHYGILEKILSRSIHGITEKTLDEDIQNLEQGCREQVSLTRQKKVDK